MCQAIVKPAGTRIYRRALALAWQQNPDGAGFAWLNGDGTVGYSRGYFDFKQFWSAYRKVENLDVLIHLRLATHGKKCLENCHPFVVDDNVVMVHNGIMSEFTNDKQDRSDSRVFAEDVLVPAVKAAGGWDSFMNPGVQQFMERVIGWNKLVFLTPHGFVIMNEYMGEWTGKTGESMDGKEDGRVWWSAGAPSRNRNVYDDGEWESMSEGATGLQYGENSIMYPKGSNDGIPEGAYGESTQAWLDFLKSKYGPEKVVYKYGMPIGSAEDRTEYLKAEAKYNPKTGAPIPLPKGEAIPDWVYGLDPNKPLTVQEVEDMIAERRMQFDEEYEPRFKTEDAMIDAYIRNRGDD